MTTAVVCDQRGGMSVGYAWFGGVCPARSIPFARFRGPFAHFGPWARETRENPCVSTLPVFLLDDHDIVRKGVRALLESEGDVEIVGEASTLADARRLVPELRPRVLVLDIVLPDGSGADFCRELATLSPETRA